MQISRTPAIVLTGVGTVLPGATSAQEAWEHIRDGRSQVKSLPELRGTCGRPVYGAAVVDFDYRAHLPGLSERHARKYSRDILMAMAAVEEATNDARLKGSSGCDPQRVGVVASSSRGPLEWWSDMLGGRAPVARLTGPDRIEDGVLASMAGSPATLCAIRQGFKGFVTTLSNACIGGQQAIDIAGGIVAAGRADAMVVVGHETPLVPEVVQIYTSRSARVMAEPQGLPHEVMKPYDRRRDGFVLGEGSVALVLEREDHARARGAKIYARLTSGLSVSEAAHATRMDLTGHETAQMIGTLLRNRDMHRDDVDYVCGHGTATRYNDVAECRALDRVYADRVAPPLGSIKPIFGHLLGASGVLNCFATAMMIDQQCLAPTINCADVDPECDQDHVLGQARRTTVNSAISLSFAIGSQSSALLLEAA